MPSTLLTTKAGTETSYRLSSHLHSHSGGSTPSTTSIYIHIQVEARLFACGTNTILHKEQKFLWIWSSPGAYPKHLAEQLRWRNEPQWKWSSWCISSWWYRYSPKPNRAQALQNASSSAAATASSLRPSWTCAVPVASLYAYTPRDITMSALADKDGCSTYPS